MNNRIKKVLLLDRRTYYPIRCNYWLRMNLNVAACMFIGFLGLLLRLIVLLVNVLDAKVSVLPKRVTARWGVLAQTAFIVVRLRALALFATVGV